MKNIQHYQNLASQLPENCLRKHDSLPASLCMRSDGNMAVYYAPFDYVNTSAKVVIVGITPGIQQAVNALTAFRACLAHGESTKIALQIAKGQASFSGPLRSNLVQILDFLEVHRWLGISSCASLFGANMHLAHFTSALKYPVLVNGKNYAGRQPEMTRDPRMIAELTRSLPEELEQLDRPLLIPLGDSVANALSYLADRKLVDRKRILHGLPHPSGANAERIAYFLEHKLRTLLSTKVNADKLDAARNSARQTVQRLLQEGSQPCATFST